jgi:hypothetical protein
VLKKLFIEEQEKVYDLGLLNRNIDAPDSMGDHKVPSQLEIYGQANGLEQ